MYKELISSMISRYGRNCVIIPGFGGRSVNVSALLNPILYRNKMYLKDVYFPDGLSDKGLYLYIGLPETILADFSPGTVVRCGEKNFTILRSEQYFVEDTAVYTWAILQLRGRSTDNDQSGN